MTYLCSECGTAQEICSGRCDLTRKRIQAQRDADQKLAREQARAAQTQGRAISARNATSHGLFARDVVLPSLGEDPGGYNEVYLDLCMQINPSNLLERHYVEKIAAASWRLRRLHRWQAQLFEDARLTEDERLLKLDKVMRHETALHRQIDTAIKMLSKHVPRLLTARAREEALAEMDQTDRACRVDSDIAAEVELKTRENRDDQICKNEMHPPQNLPRKWR